jgi:AcrR family transcriptional regulator
MPSTRRSPPRRVRAEATRRRLLRAGRRAFARRGLAGANLRDDILRPARVSVGSFYHQFGDKTELLLEILREQGVGVRRRLARIREGSPPSSFAELSKRSHRLVLELAEASPEVWRIQARERWCDEVRVRRFLRAERRLLSDWLCDEQRRLPGRTRARAQRERLSEYLLGLATARADSHLELPKRARESAGLDALVRFTAAGAEGLGGCAATRGTRRCGRG